VNSQTQAVETGLAPFVTISRQTGAGAISVARSLIKYLNGHERAAGRTWRVFERELVQEALAEHQLPGSLEEFLPERKISEIRDMLADVSGKHPPAYQLVRMTSETILHLAREGYVVLLDRGANLVTRPLEGGLHVRLVGSLARRLEHVREYFQLGAEHARRMIRNEDQGRRDYVKQNFGRNIEDPLLYDLLINTDHISFQDAARMIGEEMLRRERRH
jgi:cytidylate kinase